MAEELTLKANEIARKKSDFLEGTYLFKTILYFHKKNFSKKEKRSRRGKILKVSKLSEKRTVTGQNPGEFDSKTGQVIEQISFLTVPCF